jgi:sugar phosphate isomerase/epimerase
MDVIGRERYAKIRAYHSGLCLFAFQLLILLDQRNIIRRKSIPETGRIKVSEGLEMEGNHRIGISSFTYCFACGTRPDHKPERVMTPFDLLDKAAALGVDVVQFGDNMPLEKCSSEELDGIRAYAEERGLELEAGMRKATPDRLAKYIDITSRIGGRVLRVITDGPDFQPGLEEFCRILSAAVTHLEETGVCLGIENHDRFSAREYPPMVETVGHP